MQTSPRANMMMANTYPATSLIPSHAKQQNTTDDKLYQIISLLNIENSPSQHCLKESKMTNDYPYITLYCQQYNTKYAEQDRKYIMKIGEKTKKNRRDISSLIIMNINPASPKAMIINLGLKIILRSDDVQDTDCLHALRILLQVFFTTFAISHLIFLNYYLIYKLESLIISLEIKEGLIQQYQFDNINNETQFLFMIQNPGFIDSQSDDFRPSSDVSKSNNEYMENQSSNSIHNDDSSSSKSGSQFSGQSRATSNKLTEEEHLESEILKQVILKEKKITPFQQQLTSQIFSKLQQFQEFTKQKTGEDLVTLRIQQMVLVKLLVMSYGRSQYRLVLAHFHLGQAYLRHQCIDQAIEHISLALHKNQKLFNDFPKTVILHSYMQNLLAECLMQKEQYDDAIQILRKSIEIQNRVKLQEQSNSKTRILLAKCHCHQKQYDEAIKIIDDVLQIIKLNGRGNEQYAFALVQKALILATKDDYNSAVISQQEAINILIKINYPKPQDVAQMYSTLADYFQKLGNPQSTLACIQKVKTLYQQLYSGEDKRVIKARRKIATSLLKSERFKEAVNELLQIVELQEKVYGESSIQTARTLKFLGTVYISLEIGDARTYLKRALNIFQSHGNKKQVQEIREKLKHLSQNNGSNNNVKILSEQDL